MSMLTNIIDRVGKVEFFCLLGMVVILGFGLWTTQGDEGDEVIDLTLPNSSIYSIDVYNNVTKEIENKTYIKYESPKVKDNNFTWNSVFYICVILVAIVFITRYQRDDEEEEMLTVLEVRSIVDDYIKWHKHSNEITNSLRRIPGERLIYSSYINEETGAETNAKPSSWVLKAEETDEEGDWVRDYKIEVLPTKNGIGVKEFVPFQDVFNLEKIPKEVKIKKTKEEFETLTGTGKSQKKSSLNE